MKIFVFFIKNIQRYAFVLAHHIFHSTVSTHSLTRSLHSSHQLSICCELNKQYLTCQDGIKNALAHTALAQRQSEIYFVLRHLSRKRKLQRRKKLFDTHIHTNRTHFHIHTHTHTHRYIRTRTSLCHLSADIIHTFIKCLLQNFRRAACCPSLCLYVCLSV